MFRIARTVTVVTMVIALAAGCSPPKHGVDNMGNVVGEVVNYEGTLSLRGSHPSPLLVLELENMEVVHIQSTSLQAELRSLQGMRVAIEGEVLSPRDKALTPVIDVSRYNLLRLPTGELPVIGTLIILDGECIITSNEGKRYWMRGDLVPILREYEGERVWVVGTPGAAPDAPRNTQPYWVTGYGVLGQPTAGM